MSSSDRTRSVLGLAGACSLAYFLFTRRRKWGGEDGPIRVKGGSVVVENDDFYWELDAPEGRKREYHFRGRPNRWGVTVWKNGIVQRAREARRVIVEIARDGGGNDGTLEFRTNGAVRVIDDEGRFVADGPKLIDNSKGARIKQVKLFPRIDPRDECTFGKDDVAAMELMPLR